MLVGDVVKSPAQRPGKSGGMKTLFEVQIQPFIGGEAIGAGRPHDLLLSINRGEGETFPWGYFKFWLLDANLGRFEKV